MKKTLIISSILLLLSSNYVLYAQSEDISNLVYAHQNKHILNLKVLKGGCKIIYIVEGHTGTNLLLNKANLVIDTIDIGGSFSYLGSSSQQSSNYSFGTGSMSGTFVSTSDCTIALKKTSSVDGFTNLGYFSFGQLLGNKKPWKLKKLSYFVKRNDVIKKVYEIDLDKEMKSREKYPQYASEQEEWFMHHGNLYINNSFEQALLKLDTNTLTIEKIKFPDSENQFYCFYDQTNSIPYLVEWSMQNDSAKLYSFPDFDLDKVVLKKEIPRLPLAIEDGYWYCRKIHDEFIAIFRYPMDDSITVGRDFELLQEVGASDN